MSVVFINSTGETFTPTRSGAICTWVWELCHAAERKGTEPMVITRNSEAAPYPWRRTVALEYPRRPTMRGTGLGRLIELQRKLTGWGHVRQKAYAMKIVRVIRSSGLTRAAFVLSNDPEMAVFLRENFPHAFIVHHFHNTNRCSERFRRRFAGAVNVATAVSDFCARWNAEYFGMAHIQTIYNGVDSARFRPADPSPGGVPVINFVGRTDHSKAPDLLLRAARKLAERTKRFALQILGSRFYGWSEPDDYQRQLQSLAEDLEREGIAVHRPGFVDRSALPAELRKAHIHVVPSRWEEPCALTIFEGMASGLATVGSRTGGTPEVVGDAGLLFERDSVGELTEHLGNLITNDALRTEYSRKARARAEALTWDLTWSQFGQLVNA